jgi:hypothetical protein
MNDYATEINKLGTEHIGYSKVVQTCSACGGQKSLTGEESKSK